MAKYVMSEYPPLGIVVPTYAPPGGGARVDAVERTVRSWHEHLRYGGGFHIHVADDGSDPELGYDEEWWGRFVSDLSGHRLWTTFTYSQQERQGVGASVNAGLAVCHEITPITLLAVDDWSLAGKMDLTPWVEVLLENEDVGCVRFFPHPFLKGSVRAFKQGWAAEWERYGYCWAMRPAVYHQRFWNAYGPLPEGINALEVDRIYNEQVCNSGHGPAIVQALLSPWEHLHSLELSGVEP